MKRRWQSSSTNFANDSLLCSQPKRYLALIVFFEASCSSIDKGAGAWTCKQLQAVRNALGIETSRSTDSMALLTAHGPTSVKVVKSATEAAVHCNLCDLTNRTYLSFIFYSRERLSEGFFNYTSIDPKQPFSHSHKLDYFDFKSCPGQKYGEDKRPNQ